MLKTNTQNYHELYVNWITETNCFKIALEVCLDPSSRRDSIILLNSKILNKTHKKLLNSEF